MLAAASPVARRREAAAPYPRRHHRAGRSACSRCCARAGRLPAARREPGGRPGRSSPPRRSRPRRPRSTSSRGRRCAYQQRALVLEKSGPARRRRQGRPQGGGSRVRELRELADPGPDRGRARADAAGLRAAGARRRCIRAGWSSSGVEALGASAQATRSLTARNAGALFDADSAARTAPPHGASSAIAHTSRAARRHANHLLEPPRAAAAPGRCRSAAPAGSARGASLTTVISTRARVTPSRGVAAATTRPVSAVYGTGSADRSSARTTQRPAIASAIRTATRQQRGRHRAAALPRAPCGARRAPGAPRPRWDGSPSTSKVTG